MRYVTAIAKWFLVALLTAVMLCGNVPMQVAWAVEPEIEALSGDATSNAEKSDVDESDAVKSDESSNSNKASSASDSSKISNLNDEKAGQVAATTATNGDAKSAVSVQAAEQQPYSIDVTFGGTELNEGDNDLGTWSDGTKALNVTLTRNTAVLVDSSKTYVLSMSVPDVLYFNGIPEAKNITGVEQVSFKKNKAPQVIAGSGTADSYKNFSAYSGEIRMRLNTQVNQIAVDNLGVSFDPMLVGYKTMNDLVDALDVKVLAVDSALGLDYGASTNGVDTIFERKVNSIKMNNTQAVSSNAGLTKSTRTYISNDGFVNDSTRINKSIDISKKGSVSFGLGPNGLTPQVYSKLTVVYHIPYIIKDNEKHYLDFDRNDTSITRNSQGSTAALHLDSPAVVDESEHTITYTFKNVQLAYWIPLITVTPKFSWPQNVDDADDASYKVISEGWTVAEQKSYLGADSTLLIGTEDRTFAPGSTARFVPDVVDLRLQSSYEAPKSGMGMTGLSKFKSYAGQQNGSATGALGFFDLHNYGVGDSSKVQITFEFNAETTGAEHHVTQVNLPVDGNTEGTTVSFVLSSNKKGAVSGIKYYSAENVPKGTAPYISCKVADLRTAAGIGSDTSYYIKEVSYVSNTIKGGSVYHSEVVDSSGGSYYTKEPGLFSGWISGNVGSTTKATMTISSVDGSSLTKDDATVVSATEVGTVSADNSTAISLNPFTFNDGEKSVNLTAGQSTMIKVPMGLQDTERPKDGVVNSYHVMESPVLYLCLPVGVSIAGTDQGTLSFSGKSVKATSVHLLENSSCAVGGVQAQWWAVEFDNKNMVGSATISVQVSTDRLMGSVIWDLNNAAAIRTKGQFLKSASSSTCGSDKINKVSDLTNANQPATVQKLGEVLSSDKYRDEYASDNLGLVYYKYAESRILNISRAEAKLDVSTSLALGSQTASAGATLKVTNENAALKYDVNISSSEGGTAKDFSYYIPIVKEGAALDASAFVTGNDYSLKLTKEIGITGTNSDGGAVTRMPFDVLYTTEVNQTSSSIQNLGSDKWKTADGLNGDFSKVTAVKIVTNTDEGGNPSAIRAGSSFRFELELAYDNAGGNFAANAGRSVSWRTFGHYTYTLSSGSETTNTYPSGVNSVKLSYVSDRTDNPIGVTLDASKSTSVTTDSIDLSQTFALDKTFKIKSIAPSNLTLTGDDPSKLSGTKANETFKIGFGLNGGNRRLLSQGVGGSFTVNKNTEVTAQISVDFSSALSETATPRYVDVAFGDDDVDITVRINLIRVYTPAAAKDAGVVAGEHYSVPKVSNSVTVASNSAFTALFPIKGFVPSNYSSQKLKWKTADDGAAAIPNGTTIVMVGLKSDNTPESYWLYRSTGNSSEIDLNQFRNMSNGKPFTYDTASTSSASLKYLFVVNFEHAGPAKGSYKIAFGADAVDGATKFVDVDKDVTLVDSGAYRLEANANEVTYTVTDANGDESFRSGKTLALVITPSRGTALPADAKINDGATNYVQNDKKEFVVPIGIIEAGSASKSFSIVSSQLPPVGANYQLDAKLMLVNSTDATSPDAGTQVGATALMTLEVAKADTPAISVSGTRIATVAEWDRGQALSFRAQVIPNGGSVGVTAYSGLTGNSQVTDLLSSVNGQFEMKDGAGVYNASGSPTGKLQLSSQAKPGTYRLVFDIKNSAGATLLTVPYAIIVRP